MPKHRKLESKKESEKIKKQEEQDFINRMNDIGVPVTPRKAELESS